MSTSNYPSATSTTTTNQPQRTDYRGLNIGLLAVALLATWGYLLWNNNKQDQIHQTDQQQIEKVTEEKSEIQQNFDATLVRLDSISGNNNALQGQLSERTSEIGKLKSEIRTILSK